MKRNKLSGVAASLILILLGLFIAVRPDTTIALILRAVACVLVFYGALKLYTGIQNKERTMKQNVQLGGAGLITVAGLVLFFFPGLVTDFFPQMIGILIICLGVLSLLNVLDAKDRGDERWKAKLSLPIISIICGALIMAYSGFILDTGVRLIGVFLIYQGGSQLFIESGKPKGKPKNEPKT